MDTLKKKTYEEEPSHIYVLSFCNIPLHLVTVPGNCTHEGLPRHVPMSRGPLIQFVTASHYVIVPTVPIVIDTTHYVIVTTVFPPDTLFHTIVL